MTDFIITRSGVRFTPLSPSPDMIEASDIAHALSKINRYGGHTSHFYSVAQHSILLERYIAQIGGTVEERLWALLHDAAEAYIGDMPRPTKRMLSGYEDIEAKIMRAVAIKFGLTGQIPASVKEADDRILADEWIALMPKTRHYDPPYRKLGVKIEQMTWQTARGTFAQRLSDCLAERELFGAAS